MVHKESGFLFGVSYSENPINDHCRLIHCTVPMSVSAQISRLWKNTVLDHILGGGGGGLLLLLVMITNSAHCNI